MEGIVVMAESENTTELTCDSSELKNYLDELKHNSLLYLSSGSKELFHSDYLYWLATQHWDVFIRVMRILAGLNEDEPFWWEDANRKERNLKVKREHNHFDLSIYYRFEENKWVPVLVLENKVKSLPYPDQLFEYSANAEKEWRGMENNGKNLITFILLSLTDAAPLNTDSRLNLWTFRRYNELADAIEISLGKSRLNGYNKKLCEEYCQFVRALYGLTENWTVRPSDSYLARLCPFALYAKDKERMDNAYKEYLDLVDVRLADVWQKVSFDKMRILLEEKLSKAKIVYKRFCRDKNGMESGFYLSAGYTTSGLVELRYVLKNHSFVKDPISVVIQLQDKKYRYAITADSIINKKQVCPDWNKLKKKLNGATVDKICKWINKAPMSGNTSWCRFGNNFIYRYRQIEASESVNSIIDSIVKDAKEILQLFGK